jgi:hypothetical protein
MVDFKRYGSLFKHDIGAIFDEGRYIGTALYCVSHKYQNVSVNIEDFKFGAMCFDYIYCENSEHKKALVTMVQAIELFKRSRSRNIEDAEYKIIEWYEIEKPATVYELPFDKPRE